MSLLEASPDVGVRFLRSRVPGVRRLVMKRTKHHVYYLHDETIGAWIDALLPAGKKRHQHTPRCTGSTASLSPILLLVPGHERGVSKIGDTLDS